MPKSFALSPSPAIHDVVAAITALQETFALLEAKLAATRQQLARGTSDVTSAAAQAVAAVAESDAERVARAMRGAVSTPQSLAVALDLEPDVVRTIVAGFPDGSVYNLATDHRPRWVLTIGDDTGTDDLLDAVRRCIRERPMEQVEIVEAVGARRNRVSGAIVKLQALDEPVMNLGSGSRARWFLAQPNR